MILGRTKKPVETESVKKLRPATTPEGRENQLISLAVDLAERQLREGTASSQVIAHFLKLGTERERLDREKIKYENALLQAKTENLQSQKRMEEKYIEAINAMRGYRGEDDYDEEYEDDEYY